jgi:endonuclease III
LNSKAFDVSERSRGFAFPARRRRRAGDRDGPVDAGFDTLDPMTALITAADLGIDTGTDQGLFDWLLASLLFGRPVQQQTAATAYRKFKADGWDTPEHFTADDQHPLWHELWEGDYHRMSSVMSEELRDVMRGLTADYGGSVARLVRTAGSRAEVTARLEQFKGVGPKTAEIFLREVPDAFIGSA